MPLRFRINARSLVPSAAFAIAFVAGCGGQEPPPVNPGAPAAPAQGPVIDTKGVEKDLREIKKDVTPPVIIKPEQATAPAPAPGKAG